MSHRYLVDLTLLNGNEGRWHRDQDLHWAKKGYCFGVLDREFRSYFIEGTGKGRFLGDWVRTRQGEFSVRLDELVQEHGLCYYSVRAVHEVFEPQLVLVGMLRKSEDKDWLRRARVGDHKVGKFLRAVSEQFHEEYELGFFGDGPQGRFTGNIGEEGYEVQQVRGGTLWRMPDLDGLNKETIQFLFGRHDIQWSAPLELRNELCARYHQVVKLIKPLRSGAVSEEEFSQLRDEVLKVWDASDRGAFQYVHDWLGGRKHAVAIHVSPFYALPMRSFEEEAVRNGIEYVALVPRL